MYTILGFSKFKSRKGVECCVMQLSRDFNSRELLAGSVGKRVEEVFLSDDIIGVFDVNNVGKSCDVFYNRNGFVTDIVISK